APRPEPAVGRGPGAPRGDNRWSRPSWTATSRSTSPIPQSPGRAGPAVWPALLLCWGVVRQSRVRVVIMPWVKWGLASPVTSGDEADGDVVAGLVGQGELGAAAWGQGCDATGGGGGGRAGAGIGQGGLQVLEGGAVVQFVDGHLVGLFAVV